MILDCVSKQADEKRVMLRLWASIQPARGYKLGYDIGPNIPAGVRRRTAGSEVGSADIDEQLDSLTFARFITWSDAQPPQRRGAHKKTPSLYNS